MLGPQKEERPDLKPGQFPFAAPNSRFAARNAGVENNSSSERIPLRDAYSEHMLRKRMVTFLWSGAVAFVIVLVGQGVWGILVTANLKATPSLPWAVP